MDRCTGTMLNNYHDFMAETYKLSMEETLHTGFSPNILYYCINKVFEFRPTQTTKNRLHENGKKVDYKSCFIT